MTNKVKTAADLMAELRRDPQFCERERLCNQQNERIEQLSRDEQVQLLSELRDRGVIVESVWNLVNTNKKYSAAIPVLVRHLSASYSVGVKEGIIRALTVEYAGSEALLKLIDEFLKQNDDSDISLKWVLGNAIATVATSSDEDTLINLATNRAHGKARDMIISALPRIVKDKGRLKGLLARLAADEDIMQSVDRAKKDLQ